MSRIKHRYTQFITVDAVDFEMVDSIANNEGWEYLHAGVGANGQSCLTFGWPAQEVSYADSIEKAWIDPGPYPEIHYRVKSNLKELWPALYRALEEHYG